MEKVAVKSKVHIYYLRLTIFQGHTHDHTQNTSSKIYFYYGLHTHYYYFHKLSPQMHTNTWQRSNKMNKNIFNVNEAACLKSLVE